MNYKSSLVVLFGICFLLAFGLCNDDPNECKSVKSEPEKVYYGWPYKIGCEKMYGEMEKLHLYNLYEDYNESSIDGMKLDDNHNIPYNGTCIIVDADTNTVLVNKTVGFSFGEFRNVQLKIPNLSKSSVLNYEIRSWISGMEKECYKMKKNLIAIEFSSTTCAASLNISKTLPRKQNKQGRIEFHCKVPESESPTLKNEILPSNHSITWYQNCEEIPQTTNDIFHFKEHKMIISEVSFEHLGVYTCAITHNGMKRFVSHFRLCVTPENIRAKHAIKCTRNTYYSSIGGSASMMCVSSVGISSNSLTYNVKWKKHLNGRNIDDVECYNYIEGSKSSRRKSCTSHSDDICYESAPDDEMDALERVLVMEFTIRNVEESDFGDYTVTLSSEDKNTTKTFALVKDVTASLTEKTIGIAILIILIFMMILFMVVLWWNRIYLTVWWKRKFGSSCEDNKPYGAYFAYYFSRELDKFSQQQTRDAVAAVRDVLETLGYTVYDEYKDGGDIGGKAETCLEHMQQSHRVVIILTCAFLKDHWKVYTLQQGFEEMIKSKSKLIFVLVPGMRQYLKQHAVDNDTVRMTRRAVKLNSAIEWSNEANFSSKYFSLLLEHEMPKLQSQINSRHNSTTSSISSQVQYKNGIQRTVSNETHCTEIVSSDSPSSGDIYVVTKG